MGKEHRIFEEFVCSKNSKAFVFWKESKLLALKKRKRGKK
jgi:hypothetical protein